VPEAFCLALEGRSEKRDPVVRHLNSAAPGTQACLHQAHFGESPPRPWGLGLGYRHDNQDCVNGEALEISGASSWPERIPRSASRSNSWATSSDGIRTQRYKLQGGGTPNPSLDSQDVELLIGSFADGVQCCLTMASCETRQVSEGQGYVVPRPPYLPPT
jgi:hypothetical protein